MEYTRLGDTGLTISWLALGCMSDGDPTTERAHQWALADDEAQPFFRQAIELGVTFWDTANTYQAGTSKDARPAPGASSPSGPASTMSFRLSTRPWTSPSSTQWPNSPASAASPWRRSRSPWCCATRLSARRPSARPNRITCQAVAEDRAGEQEPDRVRADPPDVADVAEEHAVGREEPGALGGDLGHGRWHLDLDEYRDDDEERDAAEIAHAPAEGRAARTRAPGCRTPRSTGTC